VLWATSAAKAALCKVYATTSTPLSHCSTWLALTTTRAVLKLPIGWSTVRRGAINP
jgi:hypothetical protein